jgi:hypothetical protein
MKVVRGGLGLVSRYSCQLTCAGYFQDYRLLWTDSLKQETGFVFDNAKLLIRRYDPGFLI